MLTFVGLGLYDLLDISLKGMQAINDADLVYLEQYTSCLIGTTVADMETRYKKQVRVLSREDVEIHPDILIQESLEHNVVFLTGGDPMVSTTHMDLRIRAEDTGVKTRIIHGSSIVSAVCGLSGLQNYRFGKSCSIPFPAKNWFPSTPHDVILGNLKRDLHTLVYLDIQNDRFMTIREGIDILLGLSRQSHSIIPVFIGIARAGSDAPVVRAGSDEEVQNHPFGGPLHILIIPGSLHPIEEEYLTRFAGYVPH